MKRDKELRNRQSGLIQTIVIFALIIIILSLLGINLAEVSDNETLKANFAYVGQGLDYAWEHWLSGPALKVWESGRRFLLRGAGGSFKNIWERTEEKLKEE